LKDSGLGPTVLGLGAIGLLFCIVLVVKVVRLSRTPQAPGPGGPPGSRPSSPDDEPGFDADEVISRYLGRHPRGDGLVAAPKAAENRLSPSRPGFGRRGG
jgi:hypothetical protein